MSGQLAGGNLRYRRDKCFSTKVGSGDTIWTQMQAESRKQGSQQVELRKQGSHSKRGRRTRVLVYVRTRADS
ncbi:DNA damage tolerance protein RHC31 [Fusarium oxysporum f. sp. albedinis]|nr:DNA damage tolerance protein RHC31 [Fusarium oxysporum f. sp. albedinis]